MTKKLSILTRAREFLFGTRRTREQTESAEQSLNSQKDLSSYSVERQAFWPGGIGGGGVS